MKNSFNNVYKNKKVLVTGHTGFKGSWLALWLHELGAEVIGLSLPELPTDPTNFKLSHLEDKITDVRVDIRNLDQVQKIFDHYQPEIVFHLAAQPIVFRSYEDPVETFTTNAIGTVNIMESARQTDSVKAIVSITTDKVYKNKEWVWGYRENDELGDTDPYGASKAMAELAIKSYRESYFKKDKPGNYIKVAVTRAGNVIGGGDFADHRLIPDSFRALIKNEPIELRNPSGVRPWQLVLEPLSGYLSLGEKMLNDPFDKYTKAWNFGPLDTHGITAGQVADLMVKYWGKGSWKNVGTDTAKKESNLLMLDWSLAYHELGWEPVYNNNETIRETVNWYRDYEKQLKNKNIDMYETCVDQIINYTRTAEKKGLDWAK